MWKSPTRRARHYALLAAGISIAVSLGVPVRAQTERSPQRLEPVLVEGAAVRTPEIPLNQPDETGSRLGLTLREIPASVDVLTRETMDERGLTTTERALSNATGVSAGQCFGLTCFSMRGFSGTLSVPFAFDGIRYPGLAMSPRGTFNYDRIEVLLGPSSVLFGGGAVAGVVNFVSKQPTGRTDAETLLMYDATWNTLTAGAGVGGSAGSDVAWRIDGSYITGPHGSSGYVDRSAFDYGQVSASARWNVTPDLYFAVFGDWLRDSGEWYFGTPTVNGTIDKTVRENNYNVDDGFMDKDVTWLRADIGYRVTSGVSLRNQTFYNSENRYWKNAEVYVYTPATGRVNRSDFLWITHDQQLTGNRTEAMFDLPIGGLRNRALIGYEFAVNKHQRDSNSPFSSPPNSVDFLDPVPGNFVTNSPYRPVRSTSLDQQAMYFEDQLNVTPAAALSLAFRRDWLDLESTDLRGTASFDRAWNGNSWRVGGLYNVTPTATVYAQYSSALEPAAQIVTLTPAQRNYELTEAQQVEVGAKGFLPNSLGEYTLALYDINRSNILTRDPVNPALTVQIGEQSSRGIEAALVLRPLAGLTLEMNGTVLDAQYDNFTESINGQPVSRAGNVPPDVPETLGNLWVTWQFAPAWRAGASVQYVGKRAADNANTVWMDAYTTFGAWLAFRLPVGEATLRVINLADTVFASRSYGINGSQFVLGQPRSVQLSWLARFQ